MKNKIICLVLMLALIGGLLGVNGAYAWFVSSSGGASGGAGGHHLLTTGNVGYILTGSFTADYDSTAIVPEDELLADITSDEDLAKVTSYANCKMFLESTSSITSQLRIKVVYDYGDTAEAVFDNSETSPLAVKLTDSSLWEYYDGYFYYGGFDASTMSSDVIPAFDAADANAVPAVIPLFDSICYSGENTESTMISGKALNVKVIFEARQSEYVDWSAFGTINASETV